MKESVLVTGASGFIGRYVVDALLMHGYKVTVLTHKGFLRPGCNVAAIRADICEEDMIQTVSRQINRCDVIVHLAADLNILGSDQTILTNCLGTYHLLRLAKAVRAKKFIYMSSMPVIGTPKHIPVTEDHPVKPETLYHITKYAGEQMALREASAEMKAMAFRISSPIGVGMSERNFLSFLLRKCEKNETIELYGEGSRIQNYIDVRDVALAVLNGIFAGDSGVYLIAGKKGITNRDLAFMCRQATGANAEIVWGKKEDPEEKCRWIVSGQKAFEAFGFCPKHDLEETIRWIVDGQKKGEQ